MTIGRLVGLHDGDPAENMAIDQALLESVDQSGTPVLRFYRWRVPTLTLGYFQPLADRLQHTASTSLPCVRRSTGGGAIIHHHELTYSLTIPIAGSQAGASRELYTLAHSAFVDALRPLGIDALPVGSDSPRSANDAAFLCFQRRHEFDLLVSGYKVLGSAQRKARHALLQHGSLLVKASPAAPELPGLVDLTSRHLGWSELVTIVSKTLSEALSIHWEPAELSASEENRASAVAQQRFAHPSWLERR